MNAEELMKHAEDIIAEYTQRIERQASRWEWFFRLMR